MVYSVRLERTRSQGLQIYSLVALPIIPLRIQKMAASFGIEPKYSESKSDTFPLGYEAILLIGVNILFNLADKVRLELTVA